MLANYAKSNIPTNVKAIKKYIKTSMFPLVIIFPFQTLGIVIHYTQLEEILTQNSNNKKFWRSQFKYINKIYHDCDLIDEKKIKIILKRRNLI